MIHDCKILALIPARGGSKGVPRKNVKLLGDKPLIAYSIAAAQKSVYVDDIVVTTDDEEIAETSKRYGAEVPFMRPAELAADTSKTIDCVVHARDELASMGRLYDIIVLLQPTSPLRRAEDIDKSIEMFIERGRLGLCSVSVVEDNPLLLRTIGEGGVVHPLISQSSTMRRQDLPVYYKVDGSIYINRAEDLSINTSLNDNPIGYVLPKEKSIDIDSFEDFRRAEEALGLFS